MTYQWSILFGLSWLLPWLLPVALALLPPRRPKGGWPLLVPLVPLFLLFLLLKSIPSEWLYGFPVDFMDIFTVGVLLLATMWAMSLRLARLARPIACALAVNAAAMTILVLTLCFSLSLEPFTLIPALIANAIWPAILVIATILARLCCLRRPTLLRFAMWFLVWNILLTAIPGILAGLAYSLLRFYGLGLFGFMFSSLVGVAMVAVGTLIPLAAFLLLTFKARAYRASFETLFGLNVNCPAPLNAPVVDSPSMEDDLP